MPIKFEIYRDGNRVSNGFTPVGAMALGPESVPIPGEILFRDGLLIINRTALAALARAGNCGRPSADAVDAIGDDDLDMLRRDFFHQGTGAWLATI